MAGCLSRPQCYRGIYASLGRAGHAGRFSTVARAPITAAVPLQSGVIRGGPIAISSVGLTFNLPSSRLHHSSSSHIHIDEHLSKESPRMPQKLDGSCHCGLVKFTVDAYAPIPYQLCMCSMCRKTGGYGGTVNLGAYSNSLEIEGKEHIKEYQAVKLDKNGKRTGHRHNSKRSFCQECSTMLWLYDDRWPELVHPYAAAIDTPLVDPSKLPNPQPMVVVRMDSKPEHVRLPEGDKELYDVYGTKTLEQWHKAAGAFPE